MKGVTGAGRLEGTNATDVGVAPAYVADGLP